MKVSKTNPLLFLIANKADLENEGKRIVEKQEAKKYASLHQLQFKEMSAKDPDHVDTLFEMIK